MSQAALRSGPSAYIDAAEEACARIHIVALINRYASIAREDGDFSQAVELFERDATIQFPDGRNLSPGQLGEITRDNPPKLLRHHLTTIDIQFSSIDEAQCQSYIIAGTHIKLPDHWGRWDSTVRKQENGSWLFKQKKIIVDGLDPQGWLAQTLGGGNSGEEVVAV